MAIKKAQANYDNGTSYDVLHYETQASQVKILDVNGNITSSLEELTLKGKLIQSVSLLTVTDTGLYQIKNCTDVPISTSVDTIYLMSVESVGAITKQTFFDNTDGSVYIRPIYEGTAGEWIGIGKVMQDALDYVQADIGNTALLEVDSEDIVGAVNKLKTEVDLRKAEIDALKDDSGAFVNHNHDTRYLQLSGGSLTGDVAVGNNRSLAGKNTSGANLSIGRVNGVNDIVLGDANAKTFIQAKSGEAYLSDGSNNYKLFHSGNDGAGSGLDADLIDGVEGSRLAVKDATNYFTADQFIDNGKNVVLRGASGSSKAGSIYFRDGNNVQKAMISPDISGNLGVYAGTTLGMTVKTSGDTETTHDHILNAKERQVAVRFKLNDTDKGAGLYMNNVSQQLGMYDWENGSWYFKTDRASQMVKFDKPIEIQGRRLYIQYDPPADAKDGDVWININS
ncbi:hypothetical protein [Peribacillus asahii]|uniref:hypothetical protein n=1 Tax=Peribacillus asahii TaxID=228899 RepID=UPI003816BE0D